jgi:hypothetical protein
MEIIHTENQGHWGESNTLGIITYIIAYETSTIVGDWDIHREIQTESGTQRISKVISGD